MIASLLGLYVTALPGALPQDPPGAGQEQVLLTYPLRDLTGVPHEPGPLPFYSVLGAPGYHEIFGGFRVGPPPFFSSSTLLDIVRRAHRDELDRITIEAVNDSFLVQGPADGARSVRETLVGLERVLARTVRIEARLYDWEGRELPPAFVGPGELDEITAELVPLWRGQTSARFATTAELGQSRLIRYVRSANIEIAMDSAIAVPMVADLFEGIKVQVEPHALAGTDDMVLLCRFAISEQTRPMAQRQTGISGLPTLDVPVANMDTGTLSGRVADGGAILYCAQSAEGKGSRILLSVSANREDPATPSSPEVRVLPISALTSKTLRMRAVGRWEAPWRNLETQRGWVSEEDRAIADPATIESLVARIRLADGWTGDRFLEYTSGYLFLHGEQRVLDSAESLIGDLQDRWLGNAEVELTTTLRPIRAGSGAGPDGDPLHRAVFATLVGAPQIASHGVETTDIDRINAEVAQESRQTAPVVDQVFSGMRSFVVPYQTGRGPGVDARLDLLQVDELVRRPTDMKGGGDLYPTRTGIANFTHHGLVTSGEYLDFGMGPTVTIDNQTYRTHQRMRVTLR